MGQPGHSVINRLGISNFWNFNINSINKDKRNFLNNFIIKRVLIQFMKFSNFFLYEFYYNNRWFGFKKRFDSHNKYWRLKPSIIPWYQINMEFNFYWYRFNQSLFYSSKVQIMRYNNWIIVLWFLYEIKNFQKQKIETFNKLVLKYAKRYSVSLSFIYIKYYILHKIKYYNMNKSIKINYI